MDHAALVRVAERVAQVLADLRDVAVRDGPIARDPVEGLALDELGDEEGVAVPLSQLIKRHDRRMVQAGGRLGLSQHPVGTRGLDLLDRDLALQTLVEGLEDRAHAAGADSLSDPEPAHYEFA